MEEIHCATQEMSNTKYHSEEKWFLLIKNNYVWLYVSVNECYVSSKIVTYTNASNKLNKYKIYYYFYFLLEVYFIFGIQVEIVYGEKVYPWAHKRYF